LFFFLVLFGIVVVVVFVIVIVLVVVDVTVLDLERLDLTLPLGDIVVLFSSGPCKFVLEVLGEFGRFVVGFVSFLRLL